MGAGKDVHLLWTSATQHSQDEKDIREAELSPILEMGELGFVPKSAWFPSSWSPPLQSSIPPHSIGSGLQNLGLGNHSGHAGQEKQDRGPHPFLPCPRADVFTRPKCSPAGA